MPEFSKDVVITLLAASVGLAGLLLVVSGFVFAQANSFPSATTDDTLLARYERAAKLGLVPFILSLAEAGLCLIWLLHTSPCTYVMLVGMFFLLLVLTAMYGAMLLLRYL